MADYVPITAYVTTPFVFTHVLENWDALFDLYDGEIDAYMRPTTEDLNVTYVWSTRKGNLTLTPSTAAATMEFLELPVAGESIVIGESNVTFVSGTPGVDEVQIKASLSGTVADLVTALNASVDPDISKCVYDRSGNTLIVFYATPGYAGNYLAIGASNLETVILSDDTLRGGGALLTMTSTVYDTQFFIPYGATEAEYVYDVRFENDLGPQAILFGGPMLWKQGVTRFDMSGPMAPTINVPGTSSYPSLTGGSTAVQQGPPGPPGPIGPPGPMGPQGVAGAGGAGPIPSTSITDSTPAGRSMITAANAAAQTELLSLFTSAAKGLVPASGGGAVNFLRADGTWNTPAGGGGGGSSLVDTRTAIESQAFSSSVKFVFTGGFSAVGDGGHGLYKRMAVAPTAPTNKAYVRSTDRIKFDGTTDATNGGYWQLVPTAGTVSIEQFGGKGDSTINGVGGTDSRPALMDALSFYAKTDIYGGVSAQNYTYKIMFSGGHYRISDTVELHVSTHISGPGAGFSPFSTPSVLHFPRDRHSFILAGGNTLGDNSVQPAGTWAGSSYGTIIENIAISQDATEAQALDPTHWNKCGILARATPSLNNVALYAMAGKGVYIRAYAGNGGALEGNANQWNIRNLYVAGAGSDGLHVEGADANGGHLEGYITAPTIFGCGIRNESWLPNAYHGMQISGYKNQGVYKDGFGYVLINPNAGKLISAGGTMPGTNNRHWYRTIAFAGPTTQYPLWADTGTHTLGNPIYDSGGSSSYFNPYVESGGACVGHVVGSSNVIGGNMPSSIYTNQQLSTGTVYDSYPGYNRHGAGGLVQFTADANPGEYAMLGAQFGAYVGGSNNSSYAQTTEVSGNILSFWRDRDYSGTKWQWGYVDGDQRFAFFNATPIWLITTPSTTRTIGRVTPQPNHLILPSFVLQDPSNSNNARLISIRDTMPAEGVYGSTGQYARGDRYYNVDPSPGGFEGWVCTTSGAIPDSTWVTGTNYGARHIVRASAGRMYVNDRFGTSTTEPTGTTVGLKVTLADGMTWTYIGNTAPVFKQFGTIAA
jgi:hypothetical protein